MEEFDSIYVLPPGAAASNSPPDCCILIGPNPSSHFRQIKTTQKGGFYLAEMEGFEPPHALRRLADFESAPFSHLGTSPTIHNGHIIPAAPRKIKAVFSPIP